MDLLVLVPPKTKQLVTRIVTTGVNIELTRHRKPATPLTGQITVVIALTMAIITVVYPLPTPEETEISEIFVEHVLRNAAAIAENITTRSFIMLNFAPNTTRVTLHLLAKTVVFTLTTHTKTSIRSQIIISISAVVNGPLVLSAQLSTSGN